MKLRKVIGALFTALILILNSFSAFAASGATGAKPAVTPIILQADGTQTMGSSIVSRPLDQYKESAYPQIVYNNGNATWTFKNGKYQLKDNTGKIVKGRALVSDTLTGNSIGNISVYYFDGNGIMQVGWQWVYGAGNKWRLYYFNEEDNPLFGACFMGGEKDGRFIDKYGRVLVNGVVAEFDTKPQ